MPPGAGRDAGEPGGWALLAALDLPMAVLDLGGVLLRGNPALRRLAGPARGLAEGRPLAAVLDAPSRPLLDQCLAEVARGGQPAPFDAALTVIPGQVAPRLRLHPLSLAPAKILLRVEDISAEAQAQAAAEAEVRFAVIGRVAGGIAHDFNNLLAVIGGAAADALAAPTDAAITEDLRAIAAAADRGARLVRSLLGAARQQVLLPRPIALGAVLTEAAPLLRRLLGPAGALDLVLATEARPVLIDPAQLDQVLLNLAANARDAMPDGGRLRILLDEALLVRPTVIGATTIPPGRWVTLTFQDSGPGIAPEVLARVLEPFVTTRRAQGGTGLGLATVNGIVLQSGGHLAVESPPGEGARFTLFLPRAGQREAAPPPAPAPAQSAPLLLVEDEAPLRRLSERTLARAGHAVVAAEDAEAALDLVEQGLRPGLVVSDVSLPGMDGLALVRALRQQVPGLPALLVSGYAAAALGVDLRAEGIGFLAKPFSPPELLTACQKAAHGTI
ncbi:ATP-binding protein [Humitalea sp. 24SJ18S-53]|uniref:ATP-binding protein n=1 Tax=Humitalea sp. 24SJ18S-53 TaxID=3422307 RepID=UPI003D664EC0